MVCGISGEEQRRWHEDGGMVGHKSIIIKLLKVSAW